jgi:hypothetical protein
MKKENIKNLTISELKEYYAGLPEFRNRSKATIETCISSLGAVGHSAKSEHGLKYGISSYIVYLSPHKKSGFNMCPWASPECAAACLDESGHNRMELQSGKNCIDMARIRRTILFKVNPGYFLAWIAAEITAHKAAALAIGNKFTARLNGTSDVTWEKVGYQEFTNIMEAFPGVIFYDYTKNPFREIRPEQNYSLTFSYTGRNTLTALDVLQAGGNVAIVFNTPGPGKIFPTIGKTSLF